MYTKKIEMPKKLKNKRSICTSIKLSEQSKKMFYHLKKESYLLKGITMADLLEQMIEKKFIEYASLEELKKFQQNNF